MYVDLMVTFMYFNQPKLETLFYIYVFNLIFIFTHLHDFHVKTNKNIFICTFILLITFQCLMLMNFDYGLLINIYKNYFKCIT